MNTCFKCGGTEGTMLKGKSGYYHMTQCVAPAIQSKVTAVAKVNEPVVIVDDTEPRMCPSCKKWTLKPPFGLTGPDGKVLRREDGRMLFPKLRCEVCAEQWLGKKLGKDWTEHRVSLDAQVIIKRTEKANICAHCKRMVIKTGAESFYNTGDGGVMHLQCRLDYLRTVTTVMDAIPGARVRA